MLSEHMTSRVSVVLAGSGFRAVTEYLAAALPGGDIEVVAPEVIADRGVTAEILIPAMTRIDGPMMDRVRGLRLIQQWGAGLEGVDLEAATARGIAVANVPSAETGNAESVAEWCVMAAIAACRQLPVLQRTIREGSGWGTPLGRALLGRSAGIVGLGGIGQALAKRLRPFGARLLGVKRSPDPALAQALGLDWLGGPDALPQMLRESDILFLCLPLTDGTRTVIDRSKLAQLPAGAVVVNAGRGGLLDHEALLEAVERGHVAGAALDVFPEEPLDPASPLLKRPEIIATPHIGGVTDVAYQGIAERVAENVRNLMADRPLRSRANAGTN